MDHEDFATLCYPFMFLLSLFITIFGQQGTVFIILVFGFAETYGLVVLMFWLAQQWRILEILGIIIVYGISLGFLWIAWFATIFSADNESL
jgi:hypothetical protein